MTEVLGLVDTAGEAATAAEVFGLCSFSHKLSEADRAALPAAIESQKEAVISTVTVYSEPVCMQCNATHRGLDRRNIAYSTVDVVQDAEALARIRALGYRQAPR